MTLAAVQPAAGALPIAVDAKGAAALFSVADRTWRRWHSAGLVPAPQRCGGRVLWRTEELESWARAGMPSRPRWNEQRESAGSGVVVR